MLAVSRHTPACLHQETLLHHTPSTFTGTMTPVVTRPSPSSSVSSGSTRQGRTYTLFLPAV